MKKVCHEVKLRDDTIYHNSLYIMYNYVHIPAKRGAITMEAENVTIRVDNIKS